MRKDLTSSTPVGHEEEFDAHNASIPLEASKRSKSEALLEAVGAESALITRPVHPAFDPTGMGPWGNDRSTFSVYSLDHSDKRQNCSEDIINLGSSVKSFTRCDSDISSYPKASAGAEEAGVHDSAGAKEAETIEADGAGSEMLKSPFTPLPAGAHSIAENTGMFNSPFNPLPAVGDVVSAASARVKVRNTFCVREHILCQRAHSISIRCLLSLLSSALPLRA